MQSLASALEDIASGLAHPSFIDVARIAQELTVKQMRQSFALRQTPDQEPWPALKRPSYAGVLKITKENLLGYKETGEISAYLKGRGVTGVTGAAVDQRESFLSQRAYSIVARGKVSDTGLEVRGTLQRYGWWQDEGTNNSSGWGGPIPAREFWGFGEDTLDLVNGLLADQAVKVVATVGHGTGR